MIGPSDDHLESLQIGIQPIALCGLNQRVGIEQHLSTMIILEAAQDFAQHF